MLRTIEIEHFKSIKQLNIDCKKLNIFIGEPNTGKSNILEAIGLFSLPLSGNPVDLVRFENMSDFFFEKEPANRVEVRADGFDYSIFYHEGKVSVDFKWGSGSEAGYVTDDAGRKWRSPRKRFDTGFKFYKFKTLEKYTLSNDSFLLPPFGENLLSLLKSNEELQEISSGIFQPLGYKLWLRPHEGKIDIVQGSNGNGDHAMEVVISHPYSLISDTFQRLVFYLAAIETNKDSFLILEEPEVKSFPFYSKFLAERIALDQNRNQYFLSTHNPYFLLSLIEKSKIPDIGVFITYTEHYQTKIRELEPNELSEILEHGIDVFFNVSRYDAKSA
ncbi:MAG: AAA family ATPase [bacterium]|nr:AAA family ATPase [bacterium]